MPLTGLVQVFIMVWELEVFELGCWGMAFNLIVVLELLVLLIILCLEKDFIMVMVLVLDSLIIFAVGVLFQLFLVYN